MRNWKLIAARAGPTTLAMLLTIPLASSPSQAADLYVNAEYGISSGLGMTDVDSTIDPLVSGEDSDDASPVVGASLGLAVPLYELFPWSMSLPRAEIPIWPGSSLVMGGQEDWSFPDWDLRFELAYGGAREWEFKTRGADNYFTTGKAHSAMFTTRLDIPVQAPLSSLFGRLPILDPLTIYGGGGVGMAYTDTRTLVNTDRAEEDSFSFAWQADAGFGYQLSEALHLSIGWRYVNFGVNEADIIDSVGQNRGSFDTEMAAHEFTTAIRMSFWRIPLFDERD